MSLRFCRVQWPQRWRKPFANHAFAVQVIVRGHPAAGYHNDILQATSRKLQPAGFQVKRVSSGCGACSNREALQRCQQSLDAGLRRGESGGLHGDLRQGLSGHTLNFCAGGRLPVMYHVHESGCSQPLNSA